MKDFRMAVRRQTTETMLFSVRAKSAVQAHKIAEADVRADKHPGQSRHVDVTIVTCHPILEEST